MRREYRAVLKGHKRCERCDKPMHTVTLRAHIFMFKRADEPILSRFFIPHSKSRMLKWRLFVRTDAMLSFMLQVVATSKRWNIYCSVVHPSTPRARFVVMLVTYVALIVLSILGQSNSILPNTINRNSKPAQFLQTC